LYNVLNPLNLPVKLNGFDSQVMYKVEGINLPECKMSHCPESGHVYSGSYLMSAGIHSPIGGPAQSAVFTLTKQ
jgi:hypothetical protein